MAYNKNFNPDRLPVFAEPERKKPLASVSPSEHPLSPRNYQQSSRPAGQNDENYPSESTLGYGQKSYAYPSRALSMEEKILCPIFKAVDSDGSGQLTEKELRQALVNGDWSSFDPYTIKMMMRLFDSNQTGTINFDEFCGLWSFLTSWRSLFDRFDADNSGNINIEEFSNALIAFGYRLSNKFVHLIFQTYDKRGEGAMSFDLFVQSCISLKRMTDIFKKFDTDRDGYITLSFEEFLTQIIKHK